MLISTNVYDGETQARRDDVGENTHWDVFLFSPATHPQLRAFLFLPLLLSSFLSLSLFLFLRWFCSCKACNRKANCGRMIHMAMVAARVAGLWKEGACFFLTARNGREIKFLEDILPIYLWEFSALEFRGYRILILEYYSLWRWTEFRHLSFGATFGIPDNRISAIYLGYERIFRGIECFGLIYVNWIFGIF